MCERVSGCVCEYASVCKCVRCESVYGVSVGWVCENM